MKTLPLEQSRYVDQIIRMHRNAPPVSEVRHFGRDLEVLHGVFNPFIAPSGMVTLALSSLPVFTGRRVLEMGCGSGIWSCCAALSGATKVVAADISYKAIKNTGRNAMLCGISDKVSAVESDLWDGLANEQFDLIYADLPLVDAEPSDLLEQAFFDRDFELMRRFLHRLSSHLVDYDSCALVCGSSISNDKLDHEFATAGFQSQAVMEVQWVGDIQLTVYRLTRSIY
jgi:methylase of polypeptide subunit release factors